jgi:hypothetical protein
MATPYKVVFDAADPHAQARFWAEALGYVVEDNSPLVRQLLDAGTITRDEVTEIDGRLFFRTAAAARDPDAPFNEVSGVGQGGRILFQAVPEPKTGKNRMHIDLHVGPDRIDAEADRLIALGATRLYEGHEGPNRWITLADLEGNEFCVA